MKRKWKFLGLGMMSCIVGILTTGIFAPDQLNKAAPTQPEANLTTPSTPRISSATPRILTFTLDTQDRQKLNDLQNKFDTQQWAKLPIGDRIQAIAQEFLGEPYRANLLDQTDTEKLFVSLHEFDCVLFVETMLSVTDSLSNNNNSITENTANTTNTSNPVQSLPSQSITQTSPIETNILENIQRYRYRNGQLDNYCSRLNYFSEWILDNQRRGLVKDMGILPLKRSLNFMTQNWQKYAPIVKDNALKTCIQTNESNVNNQLEAGMLNYVPIESLHNYEPNLKAGDIIGIVTDIPGLDVTHSGLVYRKDNAPAGLLHASPRSGVKISPNLERYVRGVEDAIGIVVARHRD